jgi:hypothetical protein
MAVFLAASSFITAEEEENQNVLFKHCGKEETGLYNIYLYILYSRPNFWLLFAGYINHIYIYKQFRICTLLHILV